MLILIYLAVGGLLGLGGAAMFATRNDVGLEDGWDWSDAESWG